MLRKGKLSAAAAFGLLLLSGLSGFLWIDRSQRAKQIQRMEAELHAATLSRSEVERRLAMTERKADLLGLMLGRASHLVAEGSQQLEQLEQSVHAMKEAPPCDLRAVLRDPELREMMKSERSGLLASLMQRDTRAFVQQRHLTPERASALLEELTHRAVALAEIGDTYFDTDEAARPGLRERASAIKEAADAKIKAILGEEDFGALQSYQATAVERSRTERFRDGIAGKPIALGAEQEEQLTRALSEESANLSTDDEQYRDRVAQRMRAFSSPEQIAAFERFHKAEIERSVTSRRAAEKLWPGANPRDLGVLQQICISL